MSSDFMFGNGDIYTIPTDGTGSIRLGAVQDVSLSFDGDMKELYGRNTFALDSTRGKTKVSGSIGTGQVSINLMNELFFGQTTTTGSVQQSRDEMGVVPASSTYTIVAAHGGAGVFDLDLGVMDAVTGKSLAPSTGTLGSGQYSVSATGTYTFAAADAGRAVVLNYLYKDAVNGKTLTISNQLMGNAPEVRLIISDSYKGATLLVDLYRIICPKLAIPFKQDDYLIESADFSAYTNNAGALGRISHYTGA